MRGFGWGHRAGAGMLCLLLLTGCVETPSRTPPTGVGEDVRADTPFHRWDVVRRALAGPAGIVAVGAGDDGAVAWTSTSGEKWERFVVEGGRAHADTLASDGRTYVATGLAGDEARVWSSPDGRSWAAMPTPVLPPETVFSGAAVGGGSIVVVGERTTDDARSVPFAWTHTAGKWVEHQLPLEGEGTVGVVNDVTVAQNTFVAAGAELRVDLPVHGAVWSWTDRGWERTRTVEDPAGGDLELLALHAGPAGLAASAGLYDNWDEPPAGGHPLVVQDLLGTARIEPVAAEPGADLRPYAAPGAEWLLVKEGTVGRSRVLERPRPEPALSWTEIGLPGLTTELVVIGGTALAFVVDAGGVTQIVRL